jgi:hypothetical protein
MILLSNKKLLENEIVDSNPDSDTNLRGDFGQQLN